MHGLSLFNQILLSLFDVSDVFYDNSWVSIEVKMSETVQII